MGSYRDRLNDDVKAAMKAGDKPRLGVLRMVMAAIKSAEEEQGGPLADADELAILTKAVKTRRDTVASAKEAGRQDILEREEAEIAVIQGYLPEMLTGDALQAKVAEVAQEVGYEGPKDKGRFMKAWMARYKGQAEGRDVQEALGKLG